MHYPSVIHCLAITLLVLFFFCLCVMPLAKQESFFADAKIKIGNIRYLILWMSQSIIADDNIQSPQPDSK